MQKLKNNQTWSNKSRSTQNLKHLAFFCLGILSWLGFSYLLTLYLKIMQGGSIYEFPWHWDAPLWTFLYSFFGATVIIFIKWKLDLFSEKSKSLWRDFLILFALIPINAFLITAFSIIILGHSFTGRENITSYEWVIGTLHSIFPQMFVSFTCIGYFYLTLINKTKEKLRQAQEARIAMELKALQKNIEPHFLFNNLNVLSALIEKNPKIANEFLDRMAQLYRYILQTKDAEVVSLQDELNFTQNYLYLLKKRFGTAYNFDWQIKDSQINGQMIVPTALQSLLENVVKHNAGSKSESLQICVKLKGQHLIVENEIRPKSNNALPSGTGLQNLRTRYDLLTEEPFEVINTKNKFTVKIPLLEVKK
jgi:hypothetical protein